MAYKESGNRFDRKAFINLKSAFGFLDTNESGYNDTFNTELLSDGFTFSTWLYVDSAATPVSGQTRFFAIDNGAAFEIIKIEISNGNLYRFRMRINNVDFPTPVKAPNYYADRWVHYVATYDGNEVKQYLDGVLVLTSTVASPPVFSDGDRLRVSNGFNDGALRRIIGYMAHFTIFTQPLRDSDIKILNRYAGFAPTQAAKYCVLYLSMQEDFLYAKVPTFGKLIHQWDSTKGVTLNGGNVEVWEDQISGWKGRQTNAPDRPQVGATGSTEGNIGNGVSSYLVIENDVGTVTPLTFGASTEFEVHIFSLNGANNADLGGYNFATLLQRFNTTDIISIFSTGSGGTTNVQASFTSVPTNQYTHRAISRDSGDNVKVFYRDDAGDETYTHGVTVGDALELDFIGARSTAVETTYAPNGDTTATFEILVFNQALTDDERALLNLYFDSKYRKGVGSVTLGAGAGKRKVLLDTANKYNAIKNYSNEGVTLTDWTITLNGVTNTVVQNSDNIQIDKNEAGVPTISKASSGISVTSTFKYTFELDVEVDASNNGQFAGINVQLGSVVLAVNADKNLGRHKVYGTLTALGTSNAIDIYINNLDTNTPKIIRFYGIRIYEQGQRVIDDPKHFFLHNKADEEIGAVNKSGAEDIKDFYNVGTLRDLYLRFRTGSNRQCRIDHKSPSLDFSTDNKFSVYADFESISGTNSQIMSKRPNGLLTSGFRVGLIANGQIRCILYNGIGTGFSTATGAYKIGKRTKILITYNQGIGKIFVDGVEKGGGDLTPLNVVDNTQPIYLGAEFGSNPMDAKIYQVAIFKDVITDSDYKALIDGTYDNNTPASLNLVFNEINKEAVKDLSGNSNDANLINFSDESLCGGGAWQESESDFPKVKQCLAMDGISHYISTKNAFDPAGDVFTIYMEASTFNTNPSGTWGAKTILAASDLVSSANNISLTLKNTEPDTNGNDGIPSFFVFSGGVGQRAYQNLGASKRYNGIYSTLFQYDKTQTINNSNFCLNDLVNRVETASGSSASADFADINQKLHIGVGVANTAKTEMYFSRLLIWNRKLKQSEWETLADYNNPPIFDRINKIFPQNGLILHYQGQKGSFFEGATNPELKNLAPLSNFPVGSAATPDYWDGECLGYIGATAADKLADLRGKILDINLLM